MLELNKRIDELLQRGKNEHADFGYLQELQECLNDAAKAWQEVSENDSEEAHVLIKMCMVMMTTLSLNSILDDVEECKAMNREILETQKDMLKYADAKVKH